MPIFTIWSLARCENVENLFHATHAAPVNVKNITTTAQMESFKSGYITILSFPSVAPPLPVCCLVPTPFTLNLYRGCAHEPWRLPTVPTRHKHTSAVSHVSYSSAGHSFPISFNVGAHQIELGSPPKNNKRVSSLARSFGSGIFFLVLFSSLPIKPKGLRETIALASNNTLGEPTEYYSSYYSICLKYE